MTPGPRNRITRRRIAIESVEVVTVVGAATGLVALLEEVAPVAGLGVLYLLAVLFVAIRRGQIVALITAILSVLTLNFFFIEPRYRLTIADSHNVVALGVFLVVALVVGRLAAAARRDAAAAEQRAMLANAREREAKILADAASSLLSARALETELAEIGAGLQRATDGAVRFGLAAAPSRKQGELAIPLRAERPGWLYGKPDEGWDRESLARLADALGTLIDLARERDRVAARSAEAEAARRADVAKTALLHAVSHDFRSPITAITTAVSGLRQARTATEDRDVLLAGIQTEADRLARLVDDLLDLSRIEAGAVDPQTDWCDLHDVLARAAAGVAARHGERPVEMEVSPDLPLVRADPAQLERVFSNLLENAVKFSPDGTRIRVTGAAGGGKVVIRVIDEGRGIPRSRRAEIFEPFVRGRDGRSGSGLGLAICKGLAEANGAQIKVEGEPGKGATFAVTFPLAPSPVKAAR